MGADTCFGLQANRLLNFPSYNQNWIGIKRAELSDIKSYENFLMLYAPCIILQYV